MTRRTLLPLVLATLASGCGGSAPPPPAAMPPQVVRLAAGAPVTFRKTTDIAQVALDLEGDAIPVDELIAVLEQAGKPDDVTRWSVEPTPGAPAGALGRVVVPTYALPPGDFVLVLWRGDADVVGRYRFSVAASSAD
jgi:hypothetical protein